VNDLPTPPDAADDPEATELVRAWVVGEALHCTLRTGAFPDPSTWGIVLADLARHVARALHEDEGRDPDETLHRIRDAFEAETSAPTAEDEPGP
jgi:hypothetical protein